MVTAHAQHRKQNISPQWWGLNVNAARAFGDAAMKNIV
jgi:hypothetical protein